MTEVVEKFKVLITLHHDHVDSKLYLGGVDLKEIVRDAWPRLLPWFDKPRGKAQLAYGGVTIEWEALGLEEEVGEGDN